MVNENAGEIFDKIQEGQTSIFVDYFNLIQQVSEGEGADLKRELDQNQKETQEVIQAANNLNQQYEEAVNEKEQMKADFEKEIAQLKKQLKNSDKENKRLLDTLIRHSKGEDLSKVNKQEEHAPGSAAAIFKGTQNRKISGPVGKTHTRQLTLKQLKDIINDIYQQKVKYDQKCEESKLPRETMEQFMYTYLN